MKVQFTNVGGSNMSWTATIPALNFEQLHSQVKKRGAVMSESVEFSYDEESKTGSVIVGMFRVVGEFKVLSDV